jgi:hypothetical protein
MHRPFFITESQIYLSKDIERIQLRAMRIIFPRSRKSYNEAIQITNFAALLPDLNSNTAHSLRTKRTFDFPIIKLLRLIDT